MEVLVRLIERAAEGPRAGDRLGVRACPGARGYVRIFGSETLATKDESVYSRPTRWSRARHNIAARTVIHRSDFFRRHKSSENGRPPALRLYPSQRNSPRPASVRFMYGVHGPFGRE